MIMVDMDGLARQERTAAQVAAALLRFPQTSALLGAVMALQAFSRMLHAVVLPRLSGVVPAPLALSLGVRFTIAVREDGNPILLVVAPTAFALLAEVGLIPVPATVLAAGYAAAGFGQILVKGIERLS
jgi:hypothetical protein